MGSENDRDVTLLDGGMGRELQKRKIIKAKTIWSALALIEDPAVVQEVHEAFIAAGAEVIITNTYGVVPSLLAMEQMEDRLDALLDKAVELAQAARASSGRSPRSRPVKIAGSLPPLTTSYRAELVGPDEEIEATYRHIAQRLAPGVDLFICETMSLAREARAAARAARDSGKPVWVAWTLDDAASGRLRSGEDLATAVAALDGLPVDALLFNCCSTEAVTAALPKLKALTDKPLGAYANAFVPLPKDYVMGESGGEGGEHPLRADMTPERYLEAAQTWRSLGASIIGGCCGIGPEYIAVLREAFARS